MGCNASKGASEGVESSAPGAKAEPRLATNKKRGRANNKEEDIFKAKITADKPQRLYLLLGMAVSSSNENERQFIYGHVLQHCKEQPMAAKWQSPATQSTPIHLACRLVQKASPSPQLLQVIDTLIACHAGALAEVDSAQNVPLHYAIAPTTQFCPEDSAKHDWKSCAVLVAHLIQGDTTNATTSYLSRNDVLFESGDATGGCTPLYRVIQTMTDDFDLNAPSADYAKVIQTAFSGNAGIGNSSDGDKPLSLLYRRFTRQFDTSEKFFAGDNSRPEVVDHRKRYKVAARNTWKLMELLLQPPVQQQDQPWGLVHRAVQVETPPDLLRYIVETNAQELTRVDSEGNLPLHYAASSRATSSSEKKSKFPSFYSKYVMDELLYKFPEGANLTDSNGNYPLTLAVQSGKQWIGGGIQSLHDAYPQALEQINLEDHPTLQHVLSMGEDDGAEEEKEVNSKEAPQEASFNGVVKDQHHDAIMLVQQEGVDADEVTTSMWAHEEDAGVQLLGCVAIAKLGARAASPADVLKIALTGIAAVVNACKAHPSEAVVQEKACLALTALAPADSQRELSMVASGAVAAIIGAMQAHVGDAGVQQQACLAISRIVEVGGADRATVVASVSGVTALLNALAAHESVEGVQIAGLKALVSMTSFPEANLPDFPKSQTEPLLLSAKGSFPDTCTSMVDALLERVSS